MSDKKGLPDLLIKMFEELVKPKMILYSGPSAVPRNGTAPINYEVLVKLSAEKIMLHPGEFVHALDGRIVGTVLFSPTAEQNSLTMFCKQMFALTHQEDFEQLSQILNGIEGVVAVKKNGSNWSQTEQEKINQKKLEKLQNRNGLFQALNKNIFMIATLRIVQENVEKYGSMMSLRNPIKELSFCTEKDVRELLESIDKCEVITSHLLLKEDTKQFVFGSVKKGKIKKGSSIISYIEETMNEEPFAYLSCEPIDLATVGIICWEKCEKNNKKFIYLTYMFSGINGFDAVYNVSIREK